MNRSQICNFDTLKTTIQSKNGRNISKISEFNGIFNPENQHEVLFDKGAKFLIKKRRIEEDGTYRIILVEQ